MSEQIKECPFCGSEKLELDALAYKCFNVYCECGATGPEADIEEDAVLLWNAAANQLEAKDAEIARLDAAVIRLEGALSETEDNRHKAVIDLSVAKRSVEAGDKRQDALEAEIEQLRNDLRIRGDERTAISIGYIEATAEREQLRKERDELKASFKTVSELMLNAENQRDEARAWARRLYRVCEDELQMVKLINDTFRDGKVLDNLNNLTTIEKCTCGTTIPCPIHEATIMPQRYWCDTTDKAQP